MAKPHSTITGEIITVAQKTVSIFTPSVIQLIEDKKEIGKHLNMLKGVISNLQAVQRMQAEQEEKEKGQEEKTKKTKEEIRDLIKQLSDKANELLKKAREQKNRFENVRKEEFISSKDTQDIETKIKKLEEIIQKINAVQEFEQANRATLPASELETNKKVIAAAVAGIKTLLGNIKSDINLEKRLGNKEILLLNQFIQSHRQLLTSADEFKTEIEGVIQAFSHTREAAEFMEKLSTARNAILEFIETENKENSAVERIGTFMQERNRIEQESIRYIEQLKTELKSEGEIHHELDMLGTRLNECREALVRSEGAIVNFFQNEQERVSKSFELLEKLETAIKEISAILNPSFVSRVFGGRRSPTTAQEALPHKSLRI